MLSPKEIKKREKTAGSILSGALSLGLCCKWILELLIMCCMFCSFSSSDINRIMKENSEIKPRILTFQISADVSAQYIPVMNCIFSAQKKVNFYILILQLHSLKAIVYFITILSIWMSFLFDNTTYNRLWYIFFDKFYWYHIFPTKCSQSQKFVEVVNIFSYTKNSILIIMQSIPVDTCMLTKQDSPLLQQASHITGGIYLKPQHQGALLQYLLVCFLTSLAVSDCD